MMPSTTCHTSNTPRKCAPSRKVQENMNKPQSQLRKHVKTQKKYVNSTSLSPAPSTPKTMSESEPPGEIDVSYVQFTLSTICILNVHEFLTNSDIVKLGEFSYHMWNTKCIRKPKAMVCKFTLYTNVLERNSHMSKIKQQQSIIDNTHIDALMALHTCECKSCSNHDKNGWCFSTNEIYLKMIMSTYSPRT